MKSMRMIKTPAYAVKLGTGQFVGTDYQCKYCGQWTTCGFFQYPNPYSGGGCPNHSDGRHCWEAK